MNPPAAATAAIILRHAHPPVASPALIFTNVQQGIVQAVVSEGVDPSRTVHTDNGRGLGDNEGLGKEEERFSLSVIVIVIIIIWR